MNSIQCDIMSIDCLIFSKKIKQITAIGTEGELGVLSGHTPFITQLNSGPLIITHINNKKEIFYLDGGLIEVESNMISCLSYSIIKANEINEYELTKNINEAKVLIKEKSSTINYTRAIADISLAHSRLRTLKQFKTTLTNNA
ncbi:ATP synthase F1 subunit epsilon [Candidatus Portiera aleyrodidarum]|uniref:ATP synthase epsilon chain n=2 Tax=Candidatus Portiera aleyrodidarum TaxID=91844 RepID=A0AAU8RQN6_9GAMM|nr:ATP synthase F1 subunit epsilon [Candidatus Portiera aleyrodidarum]AFQ24007.1 ATP synthase, F1 epsilon subunit [Candidatus Portiera aleyrodidarum BT-B-HRs]AFS18773.1 ATP synthase epsilon chain [Candidatus Portiera aleyrodidarum BT-QVLC]AFT80395.1 ATP synthase epsilon chain [Candidatus Portiera aleyrodidarum BT-QVLC]AFT80675.1 ATP synthase epsilon chain [Candidatus Portiera aleyrodidarum BT-B-HRs]AJF23986.1 ATP synthase F1 subunit epsilon [Candidatus Portiera aleyrodidarum MED (Bemisia tabac